MAGWSIYEVNKFREKRNSLGEGHAAISMGNRVAFRSLRNHYYRARETRRDNGCGRDCKKPGSLLPLSRIFYAEFVFRLTKRKSIAILVTPFEFRLDRDTIFSSFSNRFSSFISFSIGNLNVCLIECLFIFLCLYVYLKMVLN